MIVLTSFNIKGGVGKTASAVNLAYLSARDGFRTLIWDLDPQGAATFYFRIKPRIKGGAKKLVRGRRGLGPLIRGTDFEDLDLVPADFSYRNLDLALDDTKKPVRRLRRLLRPLAGEYDRVFLDCPPSISLASDAVFAASDVLLVPTIPTTLSVRTLAQLRKHLEKRGPGILALLPFVCMVDGRKSLHRATCRLLAQENPDLLETKIPFSSKVEQMGLHRAPLPAFAPAAPATRAYEALWEEIRGCIGRSAVDAAR